MDIWLKLKLYLEIKCDNQKTIKEDIKSLQLSYNQIHKGYMGLFC